MYRHVLLPTDGRRGTERAVRHAVDLARRNAATLHVLHVVDTDALPLDAHSQSVVLRLEEAGYDAVETVRERAAAAGVEDTVGAVRQGTPVREILRYADEADADVIVMGTHGRTGIRRLLVGSVTNQVVRSADVPVLTVRSTSEE
jgi:nucleotide-binding universal stress UspA family protein